VRDLRKGWGIYRRQEHGHTPGFTYDSRPATRGVQSAHMNPYGSVSPDGGQEGASLCEIGELRERNEEDNMAKTKGSKHSTDEGPLSAEELPKMEAYWRACLYLCVGMIFLRHNPH
jgi:hypothetical protein